MYDWVTLLCNTDWHNTVNQHYLNKSISLSSCIHHCWGEVWCQFDLGFFLYVIHSFSSSESGWDMGQKGQEVHPLGHCVDNELGAWLWVFWLWHLPMPSAAPILQASLTRSSVLSVPEPQVPKNQDVLHAHSPYSESSGPSLFHSSELFPMARGQCPREYLLCSYVPTCTYVYMWLYIHVYMNVCYDACLYMCTYIWIWMSMWEVSRSEYVCLVCMWVCVGYVSIVDVLLMGCVYMCAFVHVYIFENMWFFHPRLAMCSPVFPEQSLD